MTYEQAKKNNTAGMMAMPVRHANPKTILAQAVRWALYDLPRRPESNPVFFYSRTVSNETE